MEVNFYVKTSEQNLNGEFLLNAYVNYDNYKDYLYFFYFNAYHISKYVLQFDIVMDVRFFLQERFSHK